MISPRPIPAAAAWPAEWCDRGEAQGGQGEKLLILACIVAGLVAFRRFLLFPSWTYRPPDLMYATMAMAAYDEG